MPALILPDHNNITISVYRSALELPGAVIATMRRDPRSNIQLPSLEKAYKKESKGIPLQQDEFWIVCSSTWPSPTGPPQVTVDFVLSCTFGVVGKYPIFIYGTRLIDDLNHDYLNARMIRLARALMSQVSTRRVFSLFAVEPVAKAFSGSWRDLTGIDIVENPYYAAKFSYCTPSTLAGPPPPSPHQHNTRIRRAVEADILNVADLCHGFAADSEPFILSHPEAIREATELIRTHKLWVLEVRLPHGGAAIACIVASTRANDSVAAISKVYTPPKFRENGYARRLVHEVCAQLFAEGKSYVVLYVGHGNPAAKVYHRVGFQGLQPGTEGQFKLVEPWLELGFDRSKVDLGHW